MPLLQLTLVAPRHLEEELVEQFLAHPDWAAGFTLQETEGHGRGKLTPREQVRGRAHRISVEIVLEAEAARALLAHLKARFPKPDVAWWLTPVIEFGRLA